MVVVAASSSSPRYTSDLEQARPQTSGEEELQLQLALAMSREEAEKVRPWGSRGGPTAGLGVACGGGLEGGRKCTQMPHTLTLRLLYFGPQDPSTAPRDSTGPVLVPEIVQTGTTSLPPVPSGWG